MGSRDNSDIDVMCEGVEKAACSGQRTTFCNQFQAKNEGAVVGHRQSVAPVGTVLRVLRGCVVNGATATVKHPKIEHFSAPPPRPGPLPF